MFYHLQCSAKGGEEGFNTNSGLEQHVNKQNWFRLWQFQAHKEHDYLIFFSWWLNRSRWPLYWLHLDNSSLMIRYDTKDISFFSKVLKMTTSDRFLQFYFSAYYLQFIYFSLLKLKPVNPQHCSGNEKTQRGNQGGLTHATLNSFPD